MIRINSHIPRANKTKKSKLILLKGALLSPFYWIVAHFYGVPGLQLHRYIALLGFKLLFKYKLRPDIIYQFIFFPMDSVRYFEFGFMWEALSKVPLSGNYLDISSPRLFPMVLMDKYKELKAEMVNPDNDDLNKTRELALACEITNRCILHNSLISGMQLKNTTYDIITSISVVEHIPEEDDVDAIKNMWGLVRPGGKLLLSVPCAKEAFEEYIDYNEYGLMTPDKDNYVFGQRFYDDKLLNERIFNIIGRPIHSTIYGEKRWGVFENNRRAKISDINYPFWREPIMMGKEYQYFNSIAELPGLGVIAMVFVKQ